MRPRLRLHKNLANRFNVSRSPVSKITNAWFRFLRIEFDPLLTIPPREVIKLYMPDLFKPFYPNVVAIVDCIQNLKWSDHLHSTINQTATHLTSLEPP